MEVIPAIDLRNGKVVRLYQGDFSKETIYSDDPVAMAIQWEKQGAQRLHIVDLDGAAGGHPVNLIAIKSIASSVHIPLQIGGGIRNIDDITSMISVGADRIIIGTSAIQDPSLFQSAYKIIGKESVIVGIDAINGKVAVNGWVNITTVSVDDLLESVMTLGVERIIYTDILMDGTYSGPNIDAVRGLVDVGKVSVIASGGISSMEDMAILNTIGVEAVIVGRALYDGAINLEECIQEFSN